MDHVGGDFITSQERDSAIIAVAGELCHDIFIEAMSSFNLSYPQLRDVLRELGYWSILMEPYVCGVFAHDFDMEEFKLELRGYFKARGDCDGEC